MSCLGARLGQEQPCPCPALALSPGHWTTAWSCVQALPPGVQWRPCGRLSPSWAYGLCPGVGAALLGCSLAPLLPLVPCKQDLGSSRLSAGCWVGVGQERAWRHPGSWQPLWPTEAAQPEAFLGVGIVLAACVPQLRGSRGHSQGPEDPHTLLPGPAPLPTPWPASGPHSLSLATPSLVLIWPHCGLLLPAPCPCQLRNVCGWGTGAAGIQPGGLGWAQLSARGPCLPEVGEGPAGFRVPRGLGP